MCIVFVALEQHPGYKFVILSNRDEALSRPTLRSHFWDPASAPAPIDRINLPAGLSSDAKDLSGQVSTADEATINEILGGRDAVRGGTWLAISKTGRFSVVTNFQEPHEYVLHYDADGKPYVTSEITDMKSRGDLVKDYVAGNMSGDAYLEGVRKEGELYPGFCLIVGDEHGMWLYSNRDPDQKIEKLGCNDTIGLTNTLLRPNWFKASHGVSLVKSLAVPNPDLLASLASDSDYRKSHSPPSAALSDLLAPAMDILADQVTPEFPQDSTVYDKAGQFSSIFIPAINTSPNPDMLKEYGTRCSIAIFVDDKNRTTFYERSLDAETKKWHDRVFHFTTQPMIIATDKS